MSLADIEGLLVFAFISGEKHEGGIDGVDAMCRGFLKVFAW